MLEVSTPLCCQEPPLKCLALRQWAQGEVGGEGEGFFDTEAMICTGL